MLFIEILSNSAGELKDTQKKQREGDMLANVLLAILRIVVSCLALLFIVLALLKGAIQKFLVSFGLKKTVDVATMASMLLFVATAYAGDTITRIEGGNLVYDQKTGTVIRDVPEGLTAEQAEQLVSGTIPKVSLSSEKSGFFFGFPLTNIKTETTVSFRSGWIVEGEGHESFSALYLLTNTFFLFLGYVRRASTLEGFSPMLSLLLFRGP